ncbi:AraC family transcriptional regulator [Paraflavitalea sp. CAU 1676]|uniref:helix-turn-helix transcriptional regulator n=1 Tax=Paraflavitalea sp. CAU 1676 TaxID=3032598 RepID=UPI0023DC5573|nr:AraC family transcriptional regulator [Paraflavitalea sp. CAU 1676]MDF2189759.1 AraC family transcriptional regulator [Paraflavitalea sp. CAU 1676]
MERKNLYQPFEVEYKELNECPMGPHKHNFFEMVFILDGTGIQCINDNKFNYKPDHLFLLMPQECHSFDVKTTTKFFFIRFSNIYLQSQHKEWVQKLEFIFENNTHLPGCLLKNTSDKPLVRSLVEAVIREQVNRQPYHLEVVQQIINTLITVVARNITFMVPSSLQQKAVSNTALDMVHYIHQHIYDPGQLRADVIAARFSISPGYISEYFKTHTGESLQQYIVHYRLKLVEVRLQFSELRMNEIAFELGFTDESHLNRMFRKYKGMSPTDYRKQVKIMASRELQEREAGSNIAS